MNDHYVIKTQAQVFFFFILLPGNTNQKGGKIKWIVR